MRGGVESIFEVPNAWGGKLSMPPVVGVWVFFGTTKCPVSKLVSKNA